MTAKTDRVADLERQMASLLAERGIPADPIAAFKKNIWDHITARAAMTPGVDYSALLQRVESLPEDLTTSNTAALQFALSLYKDPEALAYVRQLTDELHQHVLDKASEAASPTPEDTVE